MTAGPDEQSDMSPFGELSNELAMSLEQVPLDNSGLETGGRALASGGAAGGVALAEANALIMDLPVVLKVVLGSARMALANVAKLGKGAVVKLDRKVGESVEVLVNGRLVARGEVVVLDHEDNKFGIVLTEIAGQVASAQTR